MNIIKNTVVANVMKVYSAPVTANFWRIVKAPFDAVTLTAAVVQIQFEGDSSATQGVQGNWGKSEKPFSNLNVTSDQAGAVWIEWGAEGWTADVPLPKPNSGPAMGLVTVSDWSDTVANSDQGGTLLASTGSTVSPATGKPKRIHIQVSPLSGGPMQVGRSSSGAAILVQPGQIFTVFNPDGVAGANRTLFIYNPNLFSISYNMRHEFE